MSETLLTNGGVVEADTQDAQARSLLAADEPQPFRFIEGGRHAWLVVCDHAGSRIPRALGDLGVPEPDRMDHIGWDIGAAVVARRIAQRLDAPLIEGVYSRLVIDCNRYPSAPDAAPERADGRDVPGNRTLSVRDRDARIAAIFNPYHRQIAARIDDAIAAGAWPILLSIHSCAASLNGVGRPWQIGVGWTRDDRVAVPVLAELAADRDLIVGDNQPYGLDLGLDFTIPEHAMTRGLAHLQVEFRNDLLRSEPEALRLADRFADALTRLGDRPEWHRCEIHVSAEDGLEGFPAR